MSIPVLTDLGHGRQLIDLHFHGTPTVIGAYVLPLADGWALVETGPTRCREMLLAGLARAGVAPEEVRQVFLTHIHLDHGGGAGALLRDLPNAIFYCHESGVRHLIEPARLEASARKAWGSVYDEYLGSITPMDPSRLTALRGGESFPLRDGPLEVLPTPGHARHHLSFFDARSQAMLTGDSAGVRLPHSDRARPAVPPPDLDLEQLFDSLDRMAAKEPTALWYTHFGPFQGRAADELRRYADTVREWLDVARSAAAERPEVPFIAARLREHELRRISSELALQSEHLEDLVSGPEMAAMGFLRYLETHGKLPPRAP
ncbi:MAG: MBL fold metallo-hydrolase [Thermoplasmata archaeon]